MGDNCVDRYIDPNRTGPSDHAGGNAINVAVWLRAAGFDSAYLGFVGDDPEGEFLLREARRWGVDVSGVEVRPGASGVTTLHILPDGERQFVTEEYGVAADFGFSAVARDSLASAKWIHGARLADTNGLTEYRDRGVGVSYDFTDEWTEEEIDRICPALDIAFHSLSNPSRRRAQVIAETSVAHGAGLAIVTLGEYGSLAVDESSVWEQDAVPTAVEDTLGAGDAFISRFIATRIQGADVAAALQLAAEDGARACTHAGAWPPLPTTSPNLPASRRPTT